jgi:predicted ThiF/HesA family dinucleotide-utilizing enzyme
MAETTETAPETSPTSAEKLVGGTGIVTIGELEITIVPLSQAEESILDRRLRKEAEKAAGDHYTRCLPILTAAKDSPADRLEMLREIPRMAVRRDSLSGQAFWEFRNSPKGVALELFSRGKKMTPGLTQKGLESVITEDNVDEVADQIVGIIEAGVAGTDPKSTR